MSRRHHVTIVIPEMVSTSDKSDMRKQNNRKVGGQVFLFVFASIVFQYLAWLQTGGLAHLALLCDLDDAVVR